MTDKDNAECWSIIAFQDVINKTTGSPEIFGIHLYISAAPSLKPRRLVAALPPPTAVKDSAIYSPRCWTKIPDPDRDLGHPRAVPQSLDGSVVELEDADRIQGHFSFSALAPDRTPTHVMGHFGHSQQRKSLHLATGSIRKKSTPASKRENRL